MKHLARYFQSLALLIFLCGSVHAESVLSPDGKAALVSHKEGQVRLWDLAAGRVIRVFSGHMGSITALAFSSDGKPVPKRQDCCNDERGEKQLDYSPMGSGVG
jgi:WD40 repeat protein